MLYLDIAFAMLFINWLHLSFKQPRMSPYL